MLVLTRSVDEEIVINGNILVKVVRIAGNQVRLGIEAPKEVRIVRGELRVRDSREEKERG